MSLYRQFRFEYCGAWTTYSELDADECEPDGRTIAYFMNEFYGGRYELQSVQAELGRPAQRCFEVSGKVRASGQALSYPVEQALEYDHPVLISPDFDFDVDETSVEYWGVNERPRSVLGRDDARIALMIYHTTLFAIGDKGRSCRIDDRDELLEGYAGVRYMDDELHNIYIGSNLPQIDIMRMTDNSNRGGAADAAYEAIEAANIFNSVSQELLRKEWELAPPDEQWRGRRATARFGVATTLIRGVLEIRGYAVNGQPDLVAATLAANAGLAAFEVQTEHKCFSLSSGYSEECTTSLVVDVVATELERCTKTSVYMVNSCRSEATERSKEILVAIMGCGLLGSRDGVCHDPSAIEAATETALKQSEGIVDAAIQQIKEEHARKIEDARLVLVEYNQSKAVAAIDRAKKLANEIETAESMVALTVKLETREKNPMRDLYNEAIQAVASGRFNVTMANANLEDCMTAVHDNNNNCFLFLDTPYLDGCGTMYVLV